MNKKISKKSSIGTVFIYAISSIVIILVFYFGYRGVIGLDKANQDSIAERMQLRMKADMDELSMHYGASARFSYDTSKYFTKICFVELHLNSTNELSRNATLRANHTLIWDSVSSASPSNVFGMGERFFSFDAGKMSVNCSPYIYCQDVKRGKVSFFAEGEGDSVKILCQI